MSSASSSCEVQEMAVRESWQKFMSFVIQTKRVMQVTRRPTPEEFKAIMKVTGLGIAAIGAIGFLLQIGKQILFP
jgi:protein transport protein SEC61 subunit gamma and related proteins